MLTSKSLWFRKLLFLLTITLLWEALGRHGSYNTTLLPYPSQIASFGIEVFQQPQIYLDIIGSVKRVCIGFLLAAVSAVTTAFLFSVARPVRPFMEIVVELLRPIPPLAWIPIAILWFSLGNAPAVFIVFLASFFPIFANVLAGLDSVDANIVKMGKAFKANDRAIFWKIRLPSLIPHLFAGFKAGLGIGWMGVITAEMIGAQNGLGYRIQLGRVMLQVENTVLSMILVGILGYLLNQILSFIEKKAMPWRVLE